MRASAFVKVPWYIQKKPGSGTQLSCSTCKLEIPRPAVVFVTPHGICQYPRKAAALATAAATGGTAIVQLRDIFAPATALHAVAELIAQELPASCRLVVNGPSSLEIAKRTGGMIGMHVRERDIDEMIPMIAEVSKSHEQVLFGCSVHSAKAAERVCSCVPGLLPDYLQVGTMFPTASHAGKNPEGPELLEEVRKAVQTDITLVAIGGISVENMHLICGKHGPGADAVAVISAIASADDPQRAASDLCEAAQRAWE